jgi:pimeloyl-ACP methyl ester carboxylesterase
VPSFPKNLRAHEPLYPHGNSQVKIVLSLCEKLGLRRVVLVGHADGCLLALLTAAYLMQTPAAVNVCGLVMITPNLTVETVPTSTRLLLQTKLGRQMLRPLLRSEIGEVAIRRAWCAPVDLFFPSERLPSA